MSTQIPPDKWLKILTDCDTDQQVLDAESIPLVDKYSHLQMGEFSTPSIGEMLSLLIKKSNKELPFFTIYIRKEHDSDNRYFDTSSLQTSPMLLPESIGKSRVTFQVASNFNCQENGGFSLSDTYLQDLMTDRTQGPSASAGAGLGAIHRYRIHKRTHINLLRDTQCKVLNGKLQYIDPQIDMRDIRVGLHIGTSAVFDRHDDKVCQMHNFALLINQVFTSTMPLDNKTDYNYKVREILMGAYTGTYLATILSKSQVLVLTLIGGGVFNNPYDQIADIIALVHVKYAYHFNEVVLPLYSIYNDPTIIVKKLQTNGYPPDKIRILYL